jgi:lipopolysaccharide transport protein LptA
MVSKPVCMASIVCLLLWTADVPGAEENADSGTNETVITSQLLSFDYSRYMAAFEGDVVVVDPRVRMQSDKLTVYFDKESGGIKVATALGNVRVWYSNKMATGNRAVYHAVNGEVRLVGNAVLRRERDSIAGEKITVWLNEDKMTCEQGRLVILPGEDGKLSTVLDGNSPSNAADDGRGAGKR